MEKKINIAELLRNCPSGMELDCTCADNVVFDKIIEYEQIKCVIGDCHDPLILDKYGRLLHICCPKCVIFPKGKTTWEGFVPPCKFKDGDIIYNQGIIATAIFYKQTNDTTISHCFLNVLKELKICHYHSKFLSDWRLATEEEKQKLFDAIRENGYEWNEETKTLEKLPMFKDGDVITCNNSLCTFISIFKDKPYEKTFRQHCSIILYNNKFIVGYKYAEYANPRFATEEEKQKLFDAIKANGYRWDAETKTLKNWTIQDAKDGDVVSYGDGWTCIFKCIHGIWYSSYCFITSDGEFHTGYEEHEVSTTINGNVHLATKEQCNLLFQKIKEAGYKWNPETKTLEKLLKFKKGDKIVKKNSISNSYIVNSVSCDYYGLIIPNNTDIGVLKVDEQDEWELIKEPRFKVGDRVKCIYNNYQYDIKELTNTHYTLVEVECKFKYTEPIREDKNWELVPNKFDINTLIPFESRVLVRNANNKTWRPTIFGCYRENKYEPFYVLGGTGWKQCIPYEGNEHLLGTTNDCDDYYKTWLKTN